MWEDKNTTMKWVMVNQCYFPGDLPEAVGRPCGLESSEVEFYLICLHFLDISGGFFNHLFIVNLQVYESTCGRALMAGLIESPCEVLPPWRFTEETERRVHSGNQINNNLPPLYLCR